MSSLNLKSILQPLDCNTIVEGKPQTTEDVGAPVSSLWMQAETGVRKLWRRIDVAYLIFLMNICCSPPIANFCVWLSSCAYVFVKEEKWRERDFSNRTKLIKSSRAEHWDMSLLILYSPERRLKQ